MRNQQLYTPAVRRKYSTLHYPALFNINSYSPEVIKTVDDIIDIVKRSGVPSFTGHFIPTSEKVLTPHTIARLLYSENYNAQSD